MGLSSSVALSQLAKQMQGWLAHAHILLTCRLNVWDAGKNALDDFATYRCLNFSERASLTKNPVSAFIQRWFQDTPALAVALDTALHRPELRRVKDMVQNPLALALLCRTWTLAQGKLPATKASLYRQFVEALYEWKQDTFPTTGKQRQTLNQALAKLALAAMIQSPQPWRLSHAFVERSFATADWELWELALQLGWLKQVGVSDQDGQKVYAFHHPTFQAYFAAQAIGDWRLFLNQASEQLLSLTPIFESHWQEIILLWLGREEIAPTVKTEFMDEIATFEDNCGGFYRYRAYFLAAMGLAEFPDYPDAPAIIQTLVHWRFSQSQFAPSLPPILVEHARTALLQSDRLQVIPALESFVQASTDWIERWLAAYSLGKTYDPGNPVAIATLEALLAEHPPLSLPIDIARSLGVIDTGNSYAIQALEAILQTQNPIGQQRKAAYRLGQLDPGNALAIQTLATLLATTTDPYLRKTTQQSLQQIAPQHSALDLTEPLAQPPRRAKSRKPGLEDEQLLDILVQKLNTTPDLATQIRIAGRLGQAEATHVLARDWLVQILKTCDRKSLLRQASEQLRGFSTTVDGQRPLQAHRLEQTLPLVQAIYETAVPESGPRYQECFRLLWHWSQMLPYEKFKALWNKQLHRDDAAMD